MYAESSLLLEYKKVTSRSFSEERKNILECLEIRSSALNVPLSDMPRLDTLRIERVQGAIIIKNLPLLELLHVQSISTINISPDLPCVESMIIWSADKTVLPETLPKLKILNLNDIIDVTLPTSLPDLEELRLVAIDQDLCISKMSLPNLKLLDISYSSIKTLPHLPQLEKLVARHSELAEIGGSYPNLKEIDCSQSKRLISISKTINPTILKANMCPSLISFPRPKEGYKGFSFGTKQPIGFAFLFTKKETTTEKTRAIPLNFYDTPLHRFAQNALFDKRLIPLITTYL
jgi:Leucine-rich repeat (LRR) protein